MQEWITRVGDKQNNKKCWGEGELQTRHWKTRQRKVRVSKEKIIASVEQLNERPNIVSHLRIMNKLY